MAITSSDGHLMHIPIIAQEDADGLLKAHESYGDSWKKRGGIGAYMIMIRKFDRMERAVEKAGWDIFEAVRKDRRVEGVLDDIRDARRYLMLIESAMREAGLVESGNHRDNVPEHEPNGGCECPECRARRKLAEVPHGPLCCCVDCKTLRKDKGDARRYLMLTESAIVPHGPLCCKDKGKKQEYTVGYMFNDDMTQILLLLKEHGPKCIVGYWNGIGGHMEDGETPIQCQVREFEEETGVKTTENDWAKFTKLVGDDFLVHLFWGRNTGAVLTAKTTTDEQVKLINVNSGLDDITLAPNLVWMIPFLRDTSTKNQLDVVLTTYCKDDNYDANTIV